MKTDFYFCKKMKSGSNFESQQKCCQKTKQKSENLKKIIDRELSDGVDDDR